MRLWHSALLAMFVVVVQQTRVEAQVTYTWNNTGAAFETAANWSPTGGPPIAGDTALFLTAPTGLNVQPLLSADQILGQLRFGSTFATPWSLTGASNVTSGGTLTGLFVSSSADVNLNVGNGTATSLALTGPTGTTTGGSIQIGSSNLVLFGNTVATSGNINIRNGTLVLDNSAGNPTSQRLTTAGLISLSGGGSTLELRGAAAGTTFSGITGGLGSAGSGDTTLRTVQNGTGALAVTFTTANRVNTSGLQFYENIGTGFIGDAGKPAVTITTAPTVRQGVISTSATTTIPWSLVTSRSTATSNDVFARWANYNAGIVASTTTSFTGDFGSATAGTNVLYNPATASTVNQTVVGNQLASVTFEPTVAGATYNIGAGNQLNTIAVLLSGPNNFTVTGGSLFSTGTAGTRALVVANPTTSLTTDSNLGANASPVTIGGQGFTILSGTTNQIGFPSAQNLNLSGGTLRVTAANFVTTNATVRFRGSVLEYDVSAASNTFNLAFGTTANTVNFTSNAGDAASTNVGGGGFSAFSTSPGNVLNVNFGGAAAAVTWNDAAQLFITNGYALKFGSTRSNATVNFQNPLNFDNGTPGASHTREINVTRGVGNVEDKTVLSGIVGGSTSSNFVKTGNGLLEFSQPNTYAGTTYVKAGTLSITNATGSGTGTGGVVVTTGATFAGTGTANPATGSRVNIASGGTIRGGDPSLALGLGTLTVNRLTVANGGNIFIRIPTAGPLGAASTGASSQGSLTAPANNNYIRVTDAGQLTTDPTAINYILDGAGATFVLGQQYSYVIGRNDGTPLGVPAGSVLTANSAQFTFNNFNISPDPTSITLTGNDQGFIFVNFTPVPEPGTILAACGIVGFAGTWVRRRRKLRTS